MLEPVVHPLAVQILNRVGALLQSAGLPLVKLTPEILKARAVREAGLSDFGESGFEEALAVLCRSAEEDARPASFRPPGIQGPGHRHADQPAPPR